MQHVVGKPVTSGKRLCTRPRLPVFFFFVNFESSPPPFFVLVSTRYQPSSFSVSLVLAYLDTPTEYLQKLEYKISTSSDGNSSVSSMVKVVGIFLLIYVVGHYF